MKKRIFNLIIVDESGSMSCIERQTINGINETLQSIREGIAEEKDTEHYVSLFTFHSEKVTDIYDCVDAREAKDITSKQYIPCGCTPLYDAIGRGIQSLKRKVSEVDDVYVTIITDGEENSSKEFNHRQIQDLIAQQKKADWLFTFIGANIDVERVSSDLGISLYANFEQTVEDTEAVFKEANEVRKKIQCCKMFDSSASLNDLVSDGEYFSNRKKK